MQWVFFLKQSYFANQTAIAIGIRSDAAKAGIKSGHPGKVKLEKGWRYKLKYLAEDSNKLFHTPEDYIYAYLFVPTIVSNKKIPAIIAILPNSGIRIEDHIVGKF